MKKLAVLSSDRGVNLEAIVEYFKLFNDFEIDITLISDNVTSEVLKKAKNLGLPRSEKARKSVYNK